MINFRKIASVIASAVMVGSTVAVAAAANYPAPFVQSGAANVALVYGSSAANTDLVAVADITASLQSNLVTQTATTGTTSDSTSVSGGDYVKLAKPSNNLNLGNEASNVFGTTVGKDDLSVLLADGVYKNDENTEYKYEQKITLGNVYSLGFFSDSDYKDRVPTIGFNLSSTASVLNYTIDFTTDAESDVDSAGDLADLETTDINILGKSYYILDAKNSTLKLTLLDTANSGIVKEGETKTLSVGNKSYEVSIESIKGSASSPQVKMLVNGVATNQLSQGGTEKLSDGSYLGIKDIAIRDVAGVVGSVEFSIGAGKLELTNAQAVELNDKTITGLTAYLTRGTASGNKERLDKLVVEWKNDDKTFITPEQELVMPGFGAIKLSMGKFTMPAEEVTQVEYGSTDYMQLKTTIKDGTATIPFLYANSSGEFTGIGKDSNNKLVTSSSSNLIFNETAGDQWLVASWNSTTEAESYLLTFVFSSSDGINRTTVQKYVSGVATDVCADKTIGDSCTLGSASLTITNISKAGGHKVVNITGASGVTFNALYTKEGMRIDLPYLANIAAQDTSAGKGAINFSIVSMNDTTNTTGHNFDTFYVFATGEDKDGNKGIGAQINMTLDDQSDGDVEVNTYNIARAQISDPDDSNHKINYAYADVPIKIERLGDSSAQKTAKVTYAGKESYADLFITAVGAQVASSGNGTTTTTTGAKSLGSVTVSDAEVTAIAGKNLIVVGGSCVNKVAAELLGSQTPLCGADFEAKAGVGSGQYLIKTFSRNGNVATLVAGYNAIDTTNAAKFLTTQSVDTTVGKAYKGTTATSATAVVESTNATA